MQGMNRHTGRWLGGKAHLRQSLQDILTTAEGLRVMRRDYGSRLPRLVDRGMHPQLEVELIQAVAEALADEPRFELARVAVREARPGHLTLDLEGIYRPTGGAVRIEGMEL